MIPYPAAFFLVPASVRYHPGAALSTFKDFELHPASVHDRRPSWRIMPATNFDLGPRFDDARLESMPNPITLHRTTYIERERLLPRDRRQRARRYGKGRRKATAIPMAREWSAEVFAPQGTPEGIARRMLAPLILAPALTVWRCPRWRRGADIWRRT